MTTTCCGNLNECIIYLHLLKSGGIDRHQTISAGIELETIFSHLQVRFNLKAVFWLRLIMVLTQMSCSRFGQSKISKLVPHIYVLGCFVNFWGIFGYI